MSCPPSSWAATMQTKQDVILVQLYWPLCSSNWAVTMQTRKDVRVQCSYMILLLTDLSCNKLGWTFVYSAAIWSCCSLSWAVTMQTMEDWRIIGSVEEPETQPTGTKPRTSHHRPKERGVETGRARRFSLRDQKRAIVNQVNIGNVSKATLGKLLWDKVERLWTFQSA